MTPIEPWMIGLEIGLPPSLATPAFGWQVGIEERSIPTVSWVYRSRCRADLGTPIAGVVDEPLLTDTCDTPVAAIRTGEADKGHTTGRTAAAAATERQMRPTACTTFPRLTEPRHVTERTDASPTCESCGEVEAELTLIRRVWVTPEAWDTEGRVDVGDHEWWCATCLTLYPHQTLGN